MSLKKTLSIIKPDAIEAKYHGKIIDFLENKGFKIVAQKKFQNSKQRLFMIFTKKGRFLRI